ncbi:uncharacterized protein ACOB8E_009647 [Sarcophilus harrisii]
MFTQLNRRLPASRPKLRLPECLGRRAGRASTDNGREARAHVTWPSKWIQGNGGSSYGEDCDLKDAGKWSPELLLGWSFSLSVKFRFHRCTTMRSAQWLCRPSAWRSHPYQVTSMKSDPSLCRNSWCFSQDQSTKTY